MVVDSENCRTQLKTVVDDAVEAGRVSLKGSSKLYIMLLIDSALQFLLKRLAIQNEPLKKSNDMTAALLKALLKKGNDPKQTEGEGESKAASDDEMDEGEEEFSESTDDPPDPPVEPDGDEYLELAMDQEEAESEGEGGAENPAPAATPTAEGATASGTTAPSSPPAGHAAPRLTDEEMIARFNKTWPHTATLLSIYRHADGVGADGAEHMGGPPKTPSHIECLSM